MSEENGMKEHFTAVLAKMVADGDLPDMTPEQHASLLEAIAHPKAPAELQRGMALEADSVQEGAPAFDFHLPRLLAGDGQLGDPVTLSDHFGKRPVALVFGSYT